MQYNPTPPTGMFDWRLLESLDRPVCTGIGGMLLVRDDSGLLSLHLNLSFVKPTFLISVVWLVYT